jgi:Leucine-rich repeat (LRR) protein
VELIERRINDSHPYAFDHRILLIDSMDLHSLPRELPDWLESLSCDGNHLTTLPALPSGLRYLNVANNRLTSLPALPGRLETLYCDNNRLKHIPELPPYLELFDCSNNRLTRLPERQERQGRQGWRPIAELRCDNNRLTELPASLDVGTLSCYNNPFKTIPPLFVERYKRALWRAVSPLTIRKVYPTSFDLTGVIKLDLGHLHLYTLPTLPSSLRVLNCNNNYLSQLPKLPAGLQTLNVSKNRLKEMPFLPLSMKSLDCSENQLERLTPLLELESLRCSKNRLTYLPTLPSTLSSLACEDNLLPSMPPLPAGLFPYQYKRNPFPAGYTVPYTPAKHRAIQERYATANETHVLDVSGMGLYEIAIPESVVQVRCADNFLRSLPTLPAGLELLECDRNSLVWLPPMPASMNVLLCANNRLSHLPLLPEGLRAIDARNNCLSKALRGLLDHCDIHRRVRGLEVGERPYTNYVSPRVAERVQQEFHVMPLKDMVSLQIATGRVGDNSFEVTTGQIIPNDLVLYIASFLCATPLKPTLKERIAWNRTHTVTVSGHPNFLVDAY